MIFKIYHILTPFVKLPRCRFWYFSGLCDIKNEAVFLILEHSSPMGVKQKKQKKKHEILAFKPLLQETWLKNWLSWSSNISMLSNKKKYMLPKLTKMVQNWIIFTPYGFIKNLRLIHARDSHVKFTGKNKVSNTM